MTTRDLLDFYTNAPLLELGLVNLLEHLQGELVSFLKPGRSLFGFGRFRFANAFRSF